MQVMVVAAHPDDIERHGGGAVARWTREGCEVVFVLCTSGNRGSDDPECTPEQLAALQEAEQREAAAIVGVTEVVFLRHEDGGLPFVLPQLREELVRLFRTYRPERVLTHDPFIRSGYLPYQLHCGRHRYVCNEAPGGPCPLLTAQRGARAAAAGTGGGARTRPGDAPGRRVQARGAPVIAYAAAARGNVA